MSDVQVVEKETAEAEDNVFLGKTEAEKPDEIDGSGTPREWTFSDGSNARTYVQKPLSMRAKMEFTGLLGRTVDAMLKDGISVDSILGDAAQGPRAELYALFGEECDLIGKSGTDLATAVASLDMDALRKKAGASAARLDALIEQIMDEDSKGIVERARGLSTDAFAGAIAKLMTYVPDFMDEAICVWLRVPREQRAWLSSVMERPADEGGFSDDDWQSIMETFIEQNWADIERFFVERQRRLLNKVTKVRKTAGLTD